MVSPTIVQTDPAIEDDSALDSSPVEVVQTSMKGSPVGRWLHFITIAVAAFGAGAWWTNERAQHAQKLELPAVESVEPEATLVTAQPVEYRSIRRSVTSVGTLFGFEEPIISSKVDGRVVRIHHDLSEQVAPGCLLLEIDPTDATLAVQQAERNLQVELSKWGFEKVPTGDEDLSKLPTVTSARVRAEHARLRVSRLKSLVSQNAAAKEELDQVQSELLVFEADLANQRQMADSAAATARLREADLEIARQRLLDTKIFVPHSTLIPDESQFHFTIAERLISEGMLVHPGTELFRLVHWPTLKLKLSVPEAYSNQVQAGQIVEVTTSTTTQPVMGKVARIGPAVDRVTRTFQVEVEVPNSDHVLKPGSFARANILTGKDEQVPTVPLEGVDSFAGIQKIFLIKGGLAQEVKVTLGYQDQQWIEIASPTIPRGEMVITSGQRILSDGAAVLQRHAENQVR